MKKFLTLALALAMVLTFSVSVFAASENVGGESGLETLNQPSDINVTVGITEYAGGVKVGIERIILILVSSVCGSLRPGNDTVIELSLLDVL